MNPDLPGQLGTFVWVTGAWFLVICYFGIPLARAYWKASERRAKKAIEEALSRTRPNTSHQYEQDAL